MPSDTAAPRDRASARRNACAGVRVAAVVCVMRARPFCGNAYQQTDNLATARLKDGDYPHLRSPQTAIRTMSSLFDPVQAGDLKLSNRVVMAPLTRNRSPNAVPRDITAT